MQRLRLLLIAPLFAAACGDNSPAMRTVGGHVRGLAGAGLVLANNGEPLAIDAAGTFSFAKRLASGTPYSISVLSQPTTPTQICDVANATGKIPDDGNLTISVNCTTSKFKVRGAVTGLAGDGLMLKNGDDELAIGADGMFEFPTAVLSGGAFGVSVKNQPTFPTQTCSIAGGNGTIGGDDVSSVIVNCATDRFAIGGEIAGLAGELVLQNNDGDLLTVTANGAFAFPTTIESGHDYAVTIHTQPQVPSQTCEVTTGTGTGTVTSAAISGVRITCTTNRFPIRGTIVGLLGTGLVLQNNGVDDLTAAGGPFELPTPIASGTGYNVTVAAQPTNPSQTCDVVGGLGVVGGDAVSSVTVNCETDRFAIGGTISGLVGEVVLHDDAAGDVTVTANGSFALPSTIESNATYNVSVLAQPGAPVYQTCAVANGSDTVTDANITSITVTCTTNHYTVGGTLSGLAANSTLVLRNDVDNTLLPLTQNGPFTFPAIASGDSYSISVLSNPSSPISQQCSVAQHAGQVANASITDLVVTCTTDTFTIGGTVQGLTGTGLVLRNGTEDLPMTSDAPFTFATSATSGDAYNVVVAAQPSNQFCTVTNGSGVVGNHAITDVAVSCGPVLTSCAALLANSPGIPSGMYMIDTDGAGAAPAMSVYCDMTTDGGGWTNIDFANQRILLANGIFVSCTKGIVATPTTVSCEMPFFGLGSTMPLFHYYCSGTDNSANYILDHMAPLLGHRSSLTLGFATLSQNADRYGFNAANDDEFCYVNGEVVRYTDPKCAAYAPGGNGSCVPNFFQLGL